MIDDIKRKKVEIVHMGKNAKTTNQASRLRQCCLSG